MLISCNKKGKLIVISMNKVGEDTRLESTCHGVIFFLLEMKTARESKFRFVYIKVEILIFRILSSYAFALIKISRYVLYDEFPFIKFCFKQCFYLSEGLPSVYISRSHPFRAVNKVILVIAGCILPMPLVTLHYKCL